MANENLVELRKLFAEAPEGQLDPALVELVKKWDVTPTALQILEVLDKAIFWGAASGFAVTALQVMLGAAMTDEGVTLEQLTEKAVWRNQP